MIKNKETKDGTKLNLVEERLQMRYVPERDGINYPIVDEDYGVLINFAHQYTHLAEEVYDAMVDSDEVGFMDLMSEEDMRETAEEHSQEIFREDAYKVVEGWMSRFITEDVSEDVREFVDKYDTAQKMYEYVYSEYIKRWKYSADVFSSRDYKVWKNYLK